MIPLHDSVEVGRVTDAGFEALATVPAYVSSMVTSTVTDRTPLFLERTEVLIRPPKTFTFDSEVHRIRWQGYIWTPEGRPKIRTRRGKVHHLSIPITAGG